MRKYLDNMLTALITIAGRDKTKSLQLDLEYVKIGTKTTVEVTLRSGDKIKGKFFSSEGYWIRVVGAEGKMVMINVDAIDAITETV